MIVDFFLRLRGLLLLPPLALGLLPLRPPSSHVTHLNNNNNGHFLRPISGEPKALTKTITD